MTKLRQPAVSATRKPWVAPRVQVLSARNAENGPSAIRFDDVLTKS